MCSTHFCRVIQLFTPDADGTIDRTSDSGPVGTIQGQVTPNTVKEGDVPSSLGVQHLGEWQRLVGPYRYNGSRGAASMPSVINFGDSVTF